MNIFKRKRKPERQFRRQPGERFAKSDLKDETNQIVVFDEIECHKDAVVYLDYVNEITVRRSRENRPDEVIIYNEVPTIIWELLEQIGIANIKMQEALKKSNINLEELLKRP